MSTPTFNADYKRSAGKLKAEKLRYRVYARHADYCGCTLGDCASGHRPQDFVLVDLHLYLTEAIDACQRYNARGVACNLVYPLYGSGRKREMTYYPAQSVASRTVSRAR